MKATYLHLSLALLTLGLLTSCGPDAIKSQPKEVTSLMLNKTSATLYLGETLELLTTVTPADAEVTFKTDNAAVATVCKKGVVKAIAPGTATITAQAGDKTATCTITVTATKTQNVALFNALDGKKYPSGSTIEYVASIPKDKADKYNIELFFSVLKTAQYTAMLAFETPVTGMVCLLGNCHILENEKYCTTNQDNLIADSEESQYPEKKKDQLTSLGTHIDIPTPAGETYKNRLTIQLKPADGGEKLSWTVNLAITVK